MINTPHNPLGKVFSRRELLEIAEFAKEFNLLVVSDEVVRIFFSLSLSLKKEITLLNHFTFSMNGLFIQIMNMLELQLFQVSNHFFYCDIFLFIISDSYSLTFFPFSFLLFKGMWERTITIGSAGKTFSVTGWKVSFSFFLKKNLF